MLPTKLQTLVDDELASDEQIIWSHKPRLREENPYIVLWGGLMLLAGAGFLLLGLLVFLRPELSDSADLAIGMNWLFAGSMTVMGVLFIAKLAVVVIRNHCTGYVITKQRAILLDGGMLLNPKLISFRPKDLAKLRIERHTAERFTFYLAPMTLSRWAVGKGLYPMAFFNVPNSPHVETLLKGLRAQ